MKIWMVRHGETDYNAARKIQGCEVDHSLNDNGRRQAEERARVIAHMKFDVIVSSPLKRARETAEIIAKTVNAPIQFRDEIRERGFGAFCGQVFEELNETYPDWNEVKPMERDQEYKRLYQRETGEEFRDRLLTFIHEVKTEYEDKQVLVVAHGGVIRLAHVLFREIDVGFIANAALEEFEI